MRADLPAPVAFASVFYAAPSALIIMLGDDTIGEDRGQVGGGVARDAVKCKDSAALVS